MRKKLILCISLILLLVITACGPGAHGGNPPELLTPESNRANTALVTRGTIEQIAQYRGVVRVSSDRLNFGNTTLRFSHFEVRVGDRVREGQLLARLDVRDLEEQLESHLELIESTLENHEFENNLIRRDIAILRAWHEQLESWGVGAETLAISDLDIRMKQLELRHAQERQELVMADLDAQLENINESLADAELLAPYDGIITWLAGVTFRDFLYPFQTVICISDEQDMFIEHASTESLRVELRTTARLTAIIGESTFDLTIRELDSDETSFFLVNRMNLPDRFDVINPDENFKLGAPVIIRHYIRISENALMIPVNSLHIAQGERFVYVNNDGVKEMRIVETGIRNRAFIEILSGLEEGDEVYVR